MHPSDLTDSELSDLPIPSEPSSLTSGSKCTGRRKMRKSKSKFNRVIRYNYCLVASLYICFPGPPDVCCPELCDGQELQSKHPELQKECGELNKEELK